ncbi:hypothetical protein KR032_009987, partial [Drosophila birchii]
EPRAMDYLCILNAFEQNYYNRVKEIERLAAAAAAASSSSTASSASPASSTASTSSASCLNGPSTASTASSTASSPSTSVREVAHAAAALAASQRLAAYQGQGQGQGQGMMYQHHRQQMEQLEQLQQNHPLRSGSGTHQVQPATDPNSSNMANSLLWQPWRDLQQAAAMHHQLYRQQQQFQKEMRVTAKELPTTKWRRERRQRTAEYQVHDAVSSDRERDREERDMDSPIDMSVSSGTLKHQLRASPPPPYREPLPGTNYAANSRPSVITQAPPKRELPELAHSSGKIHLSNRCRLVPYIFYFADVAMSDIDEHFRRSLGENYAALFSKKSPTPTPTPTPSPGVTPKQQASPLAHGPPSVSCPAAPVASHLYQQHRSPLALPVLHSPILRSRPESPQLELPPPQDEPLPLSLALHRNQAPPSPPPSATEAVPTLPTADNEATEPATPHHTPPRYNTPSPAYAANSAPGGSVGTPNLTTTPTSTPTSTPTATPNPIQPTIQLPTTPSMPAIIRVKAEPGLAAAAASSTQTPPASPTLSTNISIFTKTEASVDDHFAKALGDTWKKLQGGHKE